MKAWLLSEVGGIIKPYFDWRSTDINNSAFYFVHVKKDVGILKAGDKLEYLSFKVNDDGTVFLNTRSRIDPLARLAGKDRSQDSTLFDINISKDLPIHLFAVKVGEKL